MHLIEIVGMFIVEPSHGIWQHVLELSTRVDMTRLRHDPSERSNIILWYSIPMSISILE